MQIVANIVIVRFNNEYKLRIVYSPNRERQKTVRKDSLRKLWLSTVLCAVFHNISFTNFDILLTVLHLSIFLSIINQLDAQNFCSTIIYFMPLHVSSTCAHHQEVKIVLHSLWYPHTYRCDDIRSCVMQFWPPDDEHMCSNHVEAWNKLNVKQKFCASSWLITEINFIHSWKITLKFVTIRMAKIHE